MSEPIPAAELAAMRKRNDGMVIAVLKRDVTRLLAEVERLKAALAAKGGE